MSDQDHTDPAAGIYCRPLEDVSTVLKDVYYATKILKNLRVIFPP